MRIFTVSMMALAVAGAASAAPSETPDPLQWMEAPHDPKALEWARQSTAQTRQALSALPGYAANLKELKGILSDASVQPDVMILGQRAVRFLRDSQHPYGLLQVAARDAAGNAVDWTTALDVAALRKKEGVPYELQAYSLSDACLAPAYTRCLLRLSPGGGDEVEIREFDLVGAAFVDNGFKVPKSRAFANWLSADRILVAYTGGGQPTSIAGWPVTYRAWQRGTPLSSAMPMFSGKPTDALVQANTFDLNGQVRSVIARAIDYSTFELSVVKADGTSTVSPLPPHLKPFGVLGHTDRHVLVQLTQAATIEGRPYPAESLLALDVFAEDGAPSVSSVYQPKDGEYLDLVGGGVGSDGKRVYFVINHGLRQQLAIAEVRPVGEWTSRKLIELNPGEKASLIDGRSDGRGVVLAVSGFTTPRSQYLVRPDASRMLLAQDPTLIDASGFQTEIGTATSKDGTKVDYYLLHPRQQKAGVKPLLMTGYGAFGLSFKPGYFDAYVGGPSIKLWLERGGSLAIPAVRGGGERGAAWHQAAMREKRQNSYDDFIAVTEHLISNGDATKGHIGMFGQSNGGLLAATLGTQRPDLFSALVSDVPLTDLIRMRHMGMGAAWMNEYGNPDNAAERSALLSYSPYQNVREGVRYSPTLVTISTEDNRVGPGHARKFAHRLMDVGAPTYFYEDEEGGHGVSDALRNPELMALRMTFLIDTLMPKVD
ncbi:prolyl oligopeptidase family serine peptidase [uncultured Stenotrophomonas sp.]|uniref:prolyl oligopeptidase family serine peptidase n=1 Tax=uncultured Stenotrophomonas sp. TaxID=165438 RepID=UPI0025FF09DB|nr:prolyl oligopeptidase family serine peptidase [uncultured Stenotrophomonas sp.]